MCNNTTNNCGCEPTCGCQQPCDCAVPCQCPPAPCVEGCLTDTKTDCVFLSEDLDICSEILPKGSSVTEALEKLGEAVCDGVTVTVQDMKVKVDANDTTSGYLFDKITVCNNLEKTVTNINGNETLQLCSKIDTVSGGGNNILTSGPNGLYIPPFVSTGYNLTPLFSTSIDLLVNPVLGGQSILANIKKDTVSGGGDNILQIGPNGLYVPPPTAVNPTIVTKFDAPNSGILTTVTVAGNIYTISPKIKLDPSSTAPISLTADGLKVDCCIPITPANTPITITPDPSIIFTAPGIDSHTLYAKVKVDTVSSGNALVSGPNGLYCPAPGAASPTTIQTSPTVIATSINPTTYTLEVDKSTDSCNALVNGSDGGLYVNGAEEPNSLNFVVDGTDIYFEFQGPSLSDSDYEVEIQGTTGAPQTWVPGGFDSLNGVILRYYVAPVGVITETIRARVKYKCGANYSGWSSLTYVPEHTYISSNGSVTILPTGTPGEFDIITNSGGCGSLNPADFTNVVVFFEGKYTISVTYNGTLNPGEVISVAVLNWAIGVNSFVIGESNKAYIYTHHFGLAPTSVVFNYTRKCNFGNSTTVTNTVLLAPQSCVYDTWTPVPNTDLLSGIVLLQTYTPSNVANDYGLRYRLNKDGSIVLNGAIYVTVGGVTAIGADTGWKQLIDLTNIGACSSFGANKELCSF